MSEKRSILGSTKRTEALSSSPLRAWLLGHQPLPSRFYMENSADSITEDWLCWVSPTIKAPLAKAMELDWISLSESRYVTREYLKKASKIVQGLEGGWLDGWEREQMEMVGPVPPPTCFPIYLITCEDDESERIVYVGQTTTNNRFAGGHAAALKLHAQMYMRHHKWVYQCSVCLLPPESLDRTYLYLEWIYPAKIAADILNDVESHMIFDLQPELNTSRRRKHAAKIPLSIHMQPNVVDSRLKDLFFYGPAKKTA